MSISTGIDYGSEVKTAEVNMRTQTEETIDHEGDEMVEAKKPSASEMLESILKDSNDPTAYEVRIDDRYEKPSYGSYGSGPSDGPGK